MKAINICAGYDKTEILHHIDFEAKSGELLAVIGPNGAGKSTLLKVISCALPASNGDILTDDNTSLFKISSDIKKLAKTVSILTTSRLSDRYIKVYEIVEQGRFPYTGLLNIMSESDREKIERAMELTDTAKYRDKTLGTLSDGQKQRVFLARALCQEPDILILDEPVSYLDIGYKLDFLSTLKKLIREKNITAIMSIHEIELAAMFADKVLCLNAGKCVGFGSPNELINEQYIRQLFSIKEDLPLPFFDTKERGSNEDKI